MKTIAIFDDLEHSREDYDNLMTKNSGTNKIAIILLNSYYENKKKNIFSIYSLLEKKKNFFRSKLLKELSDIGKIRYKNLKIENHFKIDNFNFWEFSVFRELISYGNSNMIFLLKIIVLDNFLKNKKTKILNYSSDILFADVFKQYCLKKNFLLISKIKNMKYLDNKYTNYVPNLFKFIFYFTYIMVFHLSLKKPKNTNSELDLKRE